jgi:hypothetical protein
MTTTEIRPLLNEPSQEEIATRAFFLWENAGRPAGQSSTFWLRAEAELRAISQAKAEAAAETALKAITPTRSLQPVETKAPAAKKPAAKAAPAADTTAARVELKVPRSRITTPTTAKAARRRA